MTERAYFLQETPRRVSDNTTLQETRMIHPEKRHFIIVAKTLGIQVLLFVGILFTVWGSQKLYTLIDPVKFPVHQAEIKDNMTEQEKGAALLSMYTGEHRLTKPMYRAPYSDKWVEKDWDWTLEQIARRVKTARDNDFIVKNAKGQTVNRLESVFCMGTSHASNEECAVIHQAMRSLGVVHIDHQARV